jgi:hypothetical protein
MSKYAEDEQYENYLINKEYDLLIKRRKTENPFLSKNYNNNKNPHYKNVNSSQMDIRGFNASGIKKKVVKGIKISNQEKNTKKDDTCLMVSCNEKVCFC